MNAQIAQHLNVPESAILRVEEWVHVLFAVVKGLGARFVSKKVVKMEVKEYTNFKEYADALDMLEFSAIAGEEVVSVESYEIPAASPFLPSVYGWKLTTKSGKIVDCTNRQKIEAKAPQPLPIKYVGPTHDQFASNQGFYQ